jgi:hypothetical protein
MLKSSFMGTLLVLSLLPTGSSWSGPLIERAKAAGTHAFSADLLRTTHVRSLPAVATAASPGGSPPVPALDVWLSVFLGGGLVAMQLRRTQRSVFRSRLYA